VKDKDRQVLPPLNGDTELPEGLWLYDDFTPGDDQPATDFAAGLTSLGFIGAALRRSAWLWCLTAIVGLVGGAAVSVMSPPAYQASTSILLTHSINGNPVDEMQTDMTVAHSAAVATRAIQKLGIQENAGSFLATYTVLNQTDRVLLVTANAPTSSAAVLRASAIASAFLQFRADRLKTQDQLTVSDLQQQMSQARKQISDLSAQISTLSAQPGTESTRHQLTTQRNDATAALTVLQQTANATQANDQADLASETKGSQVLDPATAGHHSALKYLLTYALMGLIAGLAVGLAIVVIRALVSDRLRRRDDIADALGASVNLSVGPVDASRWRPRASAAPGSAMPRIVTHLRDALPERSANAAALAVVAVDNEKTAARSLVSLAISCAQDGQNVLVADLCPGAPAAHLLGAGNPGFEAVTVDGARVAVAVPSPDDVTPTGPVRPGRMRVPDGQASDALWAAYGSADVLLTLIALDPSIGAEHLRTWASDAVVMVTAGRSSWMRIHAVGEMIRLSRTPLVSAILVGADPSDESLGLTQAAARLSQAARFNGS
jgi:capsular polysaccharide biosynthesis protein